MYSHEQRILGHAGVTRGLSTDKGTEAGDDWRSDEVSIQDVMCAPWGVWAIYNFAKTIGSREPRSVTGLAILLSELINIHEHCLF